MSEESVAELKARIERMESALRYMADDKVQLAPSGYRAIAVAAMSSSNRPQTTVVDPYYACERRMG